MLSKPRLFNSVLSAPDWCRRLQDAEQRLRTIREAVRQSPSAAMRVNKSPRDRSVLQTDRPQPVLSITETGGPTKDDRPMRKRQALAKGLTQLRSS